MDDDDIEIFRMAYELGQRHGRNAYSYAVKMAERAKAENDSQGPALWLGVARALAPRSN
jgi:hypothetical protein